MSIKKQECGLLQIIEEFPKNESIVFTILKPQKVKK